MPHYEYKVIPAPQRGEKSRDAKTPEARFARTIETVMNDMAAEGWEFQRAELLPNEERSGLTGTATTWRNLLVFRRLSAAAEAVAPMGVSQRYIPDPEPELPERPDQAGQAGRPTLRAVPDPEAGDAPAVASPADGARGSDDTDRG